MSPNNQNTFAAPIIAAARDSLVSPQVLRWAPFGALLNRLFIGKFHILFLCNPCIAPGYQSKRECHRQIRVSVHRFHRKEPLEYWAQHHNCRHQWIHSSMAVTWIPWTLRHVLQWFDSSTLKIHWLISRSTHEHCDCIHVRWLHSKLIAFCDRVREHRIFWIVLRERKLLNS